jgi:hypothetical protein
MEAPMSASQWIIRTTALSVLLAGTALAGPIYQPMPTKENPGDAPPDGIAGPRTIQATPHNGDISLKYPVGSTVIIPSGTTPRRAEVINPPPSYEESAEVLPVTVIPGGDVDDEVVNEPVIHTQNNGIRYVSGGIGEHDAAHMKKLQPDFRLKFTFAASSGHYLSGVDVAITNKAGETVLKTTTEGPTLLVDLPGGEYKVDATYDSATKTQNVTAGTKGIRGYTITYSEPVI